MTRIRIRYLDSESFNEALHPRGQLHNAGQFARVAGGKHAGRILFGKGRRYARPTEPTEPRGPRGPAEASTTITKRRGDDPAAAERLSETHPGTGREFVEGHGSAVTFARAQSPTDFYKAISAAKAASRNGAAVHTYEPGEYAEMRTYLTPDKSAGFALKGDDIVSVFKHPESPHKKVAITALAHAVAEGGRRLDCFDTVLPTFYSNNHFKAVSRIKFDGDYAPDGWDYEAMEPFNNGRPDVVFMVYDPKHQQIYKPGDGVLVGDYDAAQGIQKQEVKRLTHTLDAAACECDRCIGAGDTADAFNEADHPRGQPENKGEFASSSSSSEPLMKTEVVRGDSYRRTVPVIVNPVGNAPILSMFRRQIELEKHDRGVARIVSWGNDIAVVDGWKYTHEDIKNSLSDQAHPLRDPKAPKSAEWIVAYDAPPRKPIDGIPTYKLGDLDVRVTQYDRTGQIDDVSNPAPNKWPAGLRRAFGMKATDDAFNEADHPRGQPENKGEFASKGSGSGGSGNTKAETYSKAKPPSGSLHGVKFATWSPPTKASGWEALANKVNIDAPKLPPLPNHKIRGSGVIIKEPDGRVWLMKPTDKYGGYKHTFPKGEQDADLSLRANAIKEAYEETGLKVELTGYAGDVDRDTSMVRYYFAKRVGGTPADHGWESEAVILAPVDKLHDFLNRSVDRKMAQQYLGAKPVAKQYDPNPKPDDKPASANTPVEVPASSTERDQPIALGTMKKIGGQLGTNPGGKYEDGKGNKFYIKQSKSESHARNEVLAAKLYEAANAPVLDMRLVKMSDGTIGTATPWVPNIDLIDHTDQEDREAAQQHFAAHAWLANRDAAGFEYDNQGMIDGEMTTLDPGGSLLYRAQGAPKGDSFGDKVTEWDSMRDKKYVQTHTLFGSMSKEQLAESAEAVTSVPDKTIQAIVQRYGPGSESDRTSLANRLIARKQDITKRVGDGTHDVTVDVMYLDDFSEVLHPRGQPENAGEFASKAGGSTGGKVSASAHLQPAPPDREQWPEHLRVMRIPPAWKNIYISHDPHAALQVTGYDAAGRKQYMYYKSFSQSQSAAKFERVLILEKQLAPIQANNALNQKSQNPSVRDHADAVSLIMSMGVRPGSEEDTKAATKAYGATTLEGRHVKVGKDGVRLQFTGKKGVALDLPVDDPNLADMLKRRADASGPNGQLFPRVSAGSMLNYVHGFGKFKSKDFRTLLAAKVANAEVNRLPPPQNAAQYKKAVRDVATVVSARLGNTPTVALQSYIPPQVFSGWQSALGG